MLPLLFLMPANGLPIGLWCDVVVLMLLVYFLLLRHIIIVIIIFVVVVDILVLKLRWLSIIIVVIVVSLYDQMALVIYILPLILILVLLLLSTIILINELSHLLVNWLLLLFCSKVRNLLRNKNLLYLRDLCAYWPRKLCYSRRWHECHVICGVYVAWGLCRDCWVIYRDDYLPDLGFLLLLWHYVINSGIKGCRWG